MSSQKQYKRQSTSGDHQITGESSNGLNISKDGNTYLFTGNDEDYLNALRDGNIKTPNGQLETNDPNNAASFIGMYRQGGSNIKLGNPNQQSLNVNNTTDQPKEQNVVVPAPSIVVSALPSTEPKPSPTPTPSPSPTVEVLDEGIQEFSFENLPDEEGTQVFKVIRVDQNIQDNVPSIESPSIVAGGSIVTKQIEQSNGGNVPKTGAEFTKYGSQFKLIQNDGALGNQYYYPCALFNQGDPQWGSLKGGGYTLKAAGCCYNSLAMIATYHKNNPGYTPKWFWDNASKTTIVYWDVMGKAVGLTGRLVSTTTIAKVDERLKTGPMSFEWDNTNRASSTSYANRFTKRHHWMVINGKNNNGTYTIFDPNGGRIWKNQPKEAIEAGIIRIFYFT